MVETTLKILEFFKKLVTDSKEVKGKEIAKRNELLRIPEARVRVSRTRISN